MLIIAWITAVLFVAAMVGGLVYLCGGWRSAVIAAACLAAGVAFFFWVSFCSMYLIDHYNKPHTPQTLESPSK